MIASAEVEGSTEVSEPVGVLGGRGDTDIDIACRGGLPEAGARRRHRVRRRRPRSRRPPRTHPPRAALAPMIGTPRGRRRSARSAARTHRRIAARGRTLWPAAHSSVGRRYRSRPPRRATHAGDRAVSGVDGNVSPFPRIHLRDGRTAQSADATAEEIATGFLEAFGAFDVDRATGYLADDAEISELLIETASVEGAEEELRLNLSMLEAQGYEQQLGSCEETSTSVSGTGVRCPFEFHLFGSDEIGRGPYSGSYFDVTVLDGEVVRGSVTYESRSSRPRCGSPSPSGCPPPTRMTPR